MSIKAMKQALQAMKQHGTPLLNHEDAYSASLIALRQAIEAAEKQEPVAWVQDVEFEQLPEFAFSWVKTRLHDKPLYTHPPKREWVGLTDENVRELWSWSASAEAERTANTQQHAFARALEAKLWEKNKC